MSDGQQDGRVVVRQDAHGTRFDVVSFETRTKAEPEAARVESGDPHHQTYYIGSRTRMK